MSIRAAARLFATPLVSYGTGA
jgi:hypothetical protein